jgi:tight adherence protein B
MAFAVLTFLFVMAAVLATYWLLVVRPDKKFSGRLRERVEIKTRRTIGSESVVKTAARDPRKAGAIGTLVAWHRRYAVATTARLIDSAGIRTDPQWLIGGTALALLLVVIVLQIVHAGATVSVTVGALTPFVPYFYIHRAARRRVNKFEELFPDAVSLIARALRAGHAFTATLTMVADEIDEPIKSEFRGLYEQHQYGLPLTQVFRTFAARVPLLDVRFFCTAVLMHRETGGNLAEVLDNLATVMRDRFRMRRQLKVLTAQGRMTGWILGLLPVILGIALFIINPTQMQSFIADPLGIRLFELAVGLQVVGAFAIRKVLEVGY